MAGAPLVYETALLHSGQAKGYGLRLEAKALSWDRLMLPLVA